MFEKQKDMLKNNDTIYMIFKCVKGLRDPELCNLLRSYYQTKYEGCVYWLEHPGTLFPKDTVYDISTGEVKREVKGFCAEMHHLLYKLLFADEYHLLPRVVWGSGSPYYEVELNKNNAFEYYFEQISEASQYLYHEFKNIIRSDIKHVLKYESMVDKPYSPDDRNIKLLAEAFRKHIRLNECTRNYILGNIHNIFKGEKKILGIHARGGDYKLEQKDHPHTVPPEEYVKKTQQEFASGKYEKIFIATDDEDILKAFIKCFGDRLIFYDDVPRVTGRDSIHLQTSSRPMHHYKLGLEILRDIYTLVSCNSFICGLSQVSFMVRYVKESTGERFDRVIVLNEGINR